MAESIQEFFGGLAERVDPQKTAGMDASFQFVATGDNAGEWYAKIVDGKTDVVKGTVADPTIVLTADAEDWLALINGDMNGQTAFLTGKMRIEGDVTLAMKLESLFNLG